MFVAKLLVAALAALSGIAIAAPSSSSRDTGLLERDGGICHPGMTYFGFHRKCKCNDDDYYYGNDDDDCYDYEQKRCHPKPHHEDQCGHGEKQYCAKSQDEWCEYDKNNKLCYNDKGTKTFCCKPQDVHKKIREVCPSHPACPPHQNWDYKTGRCECPKGKIWHKNQCVWKPMEKPKCHGKKIAYCAKDSTHFCPYDEWNPWCGKDSRHITFCCQPEKGKPEKKCKAKWDHGKDWDSDSDSDRDD